MEEYKNYLRSHNMKYLELKGKDDVEGVAVIFKCENIQPLVVSVIFSDDNLVRFACRDFIDTTRHSITADEMACFQTHEIATFTNRSLASALKLCNNLNEKCRWGKFYIDNKKNLIATGYNVVQLGYVGLACEHLASMLAEMVDCHYPEIKKVANSNK